MNYSIKKVEMLMVLLLRAKKLFSNDIWQQYCSYNRENSLLNGLLMVAIALLINFYARPSSIISFTSIINWNILHLFSLHHHPCLPESVSHHSHTAEKKTAKREKIHTKN